MISKRKKVIAEQIREIWQIYDFDYCDLQKEKKRSSLPYLHENCLQLLLASLIQLQFELQLACEIFKNLEIGPLA